MAGLASNALTLADWAKRLDPSGKTSTIVELLHQTNAILDDALFMEGNLPTGHRVTVRTGLPTVAWRLLNQGVAPSKSTTAQIDEACAILEAWSEVDEELAILNGNTSEFRLSEGKAFIEAMNQEMASTLFYGTAASPEEFVGLATRYSSLSATNAQNIVSGGGSGSDNSSIWLVGWGDQSLFGIFPKGSKAGVDHRDLGLQVVETTAGIAGNRMMAYRDKWCWKTGIALKDWRYVVRIPNLDVSNLTAKTSAADLVELMIKAVHRIPNIAMVKPVFYMNRTCFQMLDIQRRDSIIAGGGLTWDTVDGKRQASFRGIPVKLCDVLTETESAVS